VSDVHALVAAALAAANGPVHIDIRPFPYASTHRLDAVDVTFGDGSTRALIAKHVHEGAFLDEARGCRAAFRHDAARERVVYQRFLAGCAGVPALVAADDRMLILERVPGVPLVETARPDAWHAAAARLATLHGLGRGVLRGRPPWTERLVVERPDAWWQGSAHRPDPRLTAAHCAAIERIADLPWTLTHGDCYPANVVVDLGCRPPEAVIVDWGAARLAPGLFDLAALTSGDWDARDRDAITAAYRAVAIEEGWAPTTWRDAGVFARDLAACRIHLALEQLAWGDTTRDWLVDARTAAEEVT